MYLFPVGIRRFERRCQLPFPDSEKGKHSRAAFGDTGTLSSKEKTKRRIPEFCLTHRDSPATAAYLPAVPAFAGESGQIIRENNNRLFRTEDHFPTGRNPCGDITPQPGLSRITS